MAEPAAFFGLRISPGEVYPLETLRDVHITNIAFGDGSSPLSAQTSIVPVLSTMVSTLPGQMTAEPHQKLLDALESGKDRVWVLKIEQDLIDFLHNPQ